MGLAMEYVDQRLARPARLAPLIAADLDGGGAFDLAVFDISTADPVVLWNDGLGGFGAPLVLGLGTVPSVLQAVELVGVADLALVDGASVRVWINGGDGSFGLPQSYAAGRAPAGLVAADFDGAGRVDLAASGAWQVDGSLEWVVSVLLSGCFP